MKKAEVVLLLFITMAAGETRPRFQEYALVLEDVPVARKIQSRAFESAGAKAQLAQIRTAQAGVLAELKRRQVPVTGTTQVLVNAVLVSATRERAAELRDIPGVSYVVRVPRIKPDLDRAAGLQNVSAAWSAVGGAANAGAGVKIGIIDSGIDQSHPGFQDASLRPPGGFPKGETAYTNSKVIVARSYVQEVAKGFSTDPTETSRPDDYTPR